MSNGRVLHLRAQVVRANQARRNVSARSEENVKLGRSPGWNLARAERSKLCVYAYVEKKKGFHGVKDPVKPIINTREFCLVVCSVTSVNCVDVNARLPIRMELDIAPGESQGYSKFPHTGKIIQGGKGHGQDQQRRATMLFDSGVEVSIIDTTFGRRVGCMIDDC